MAVFVSSLQLHKVKEMIDIAKNIFKFVLIVTFKEYFYEKAIFNYEL